MDCATQCRIQRFWSLPLAGDYNSGYLSCCCFNFDHSFLKNLLCASPPTLWMSCTKSLRSPFKLVKRKIQTPGMVLILEPILLASPSGLDREVKYNSIGYHNIAQLNMSKQCSLPDQQVTWLSNMLPHTEGQWRAAQAQIYLSWYMEHDRAAVQHTSMDNTKMYFLASLD